MRPFLPMTFLLLPWLAMAQQQYEETENPSNMASGVYYQVGPGSNNTLDWTYPYGTKLTVMAAGTSTRNFELTTTKYPDGELRIRQWDPSQNEWTLWRQVLTENQDGKFMALGEFGIGNPDEARENSFLKISRGSEGKDRALVSYGDDDSYKWHVGLLYGGGWETPDFYISTKDSFRNEGVIVHEPEFTITTSGDVGIGIRIPDAKLAVNGNIHAKEVKVDLTGWPDYVFKEGYDLPTLEEVEKHIREKGHLINIPSAKEVEENGIELGEMNKLLLEKIEELMIYTLDQEKRLELQDDEIRFLKRKLKRISKLEDEIKTLKSNGS
ncbi:tail fiber protein [Muricauda brasiliensis]|uniref:tail fiber protein n=1 Tax=Muricauda brasiliensis TaxID=2162892 RepID=UPI000D37C70C|nr:tail fiber protein [Muricauda brasiliensis]